MGSISNNDSGGIAERALQQSLLYARDRKQGKHFKNDDPKSVEIINHPDVLKMLLKNISFRI